jgi:aconitate hydratase 2/2-methylisocitrate dehydratase
LGEGANVYLASAELAAIAAVMGKLPTPAEYLSYASKIKSMASDIYRYLNFNEIESYQKSADEGKRIAAVEIQTVAI